MYSVTIRPKSMAVDFPKMTLGIPLFKKLQAKTNKPLDTEIYKDYNLSQSWDRITISVEEANRLNMLYGMFMDSDDEVVEITSYQQFLCFGIENLSNTARAVLRFDKQAFMKLWEENGCKKELDVDKKININTIPIY